MAVDCWKSNVKKMKSVLTVSRNGECEGILSGNHDGKSVDPVS